MHYIGHSRNVRSNFICAIQYCFLLWAVMIPMAHLTNFRQSRFLGFVTYRPKGANPMYERELQRQRCEILQPNT
jgi:hypothetical protein